MLLDMRKRTCFSSSVFFCLTNPALRYWFKLMAMFARSQWSVAIVCSRPKLNISPPVTSNQFEMFSLENFGFFSSQNWASSIEQFNYIHKIYPCIASKKHFVLSWKRVDLIQRLNQLHQLLAVCRHWSWWRYRHNLDWLLIGVFSTGIEAFIKENPHGLPSGDNHSI